MPKSNGVALKRRGPCDYLQTGFSSAGSLLEHKVEQVAVRVWLAQYKNAERNISIFDNANYTINKDDCKSLLIYAGSSMPAIQFMAFETIVHRLAINPTILDKFQESFGVAVPIDSIVTSWKQGNMFYNESWVQMHNLVLRCFTRHHESNSVLGAYAQLYQYKTSNRDFDFSDFEQILLRCKDNTDISLAVEFMARSWNGKGLRSYVERKGFGDTVLYNCAIAIDRRYEHMFDSRKYELRLYGPFVRFAMLFISELWASVRTLGKEKLDELASDSSLIERGMWAKIFKIFWMSQRPVAWDVPPKFSSQPSRPWSKECHNELPDHPDHRYAKLREALLQLERTYTNPLRRRICKLDAQGHTDYADDSYSDPTKFQQIKSHRTFPFQSLTNFGLGQRACTTY
ncbi:hypothetical protein SCHPADRAFT_567603 [Schizopora paradoxa]|uniref:Uncharacterized protein n=1 Tax=Schizopora paradoxa TaxID=27342 RepID=A0A0H2RC45_9AGAM|nr:hypothetical protein SCHPADRAFT_567603 [Schizopora paradoxa]